MTDEIELAESFEGERPRLRGIAMRMLGSSHAADDAVQEAWLRLVRTDKAGEQIENLPGWLTTELMGVLRKLKTEFTLAHMGMFLARDGIQQPGFQQLLELLRSGNERCWVKLTGVYRMSIAPGFADAAPLAKALIAAAPHRVIWGSDYPHLSFADRVGSIELFNLLAQWAPDEAVRRRILVDNPQRLFKF